MIILLLIFPLLSRDSCLVDCRVKVSSGGSNPCPDDALGPDSSPRMTLMQRFMKITLPLANILLNITLAFTEMCGLLVKILYCVTCYSVYLTFNKLGVALVHIGVFLNNIVYDIRRHYGDLGQHSRHHPGVDAGHLSDAHKEIFQMSHKPHLNSSFTTPTAVIKGEHSVNSERTHYFVDHYSHLRPQAKLQLFNSELAREVGRIAVLTSIKNVSEEAHNTTEPPPIPITSLQFGGYLPPPRYFSSFEPPRQTVYYPASYSVLLVPIILLLTSCALAALYNRSLGQPTPLIFNHKGQSVLSCPKNFPSRLVNFSFYRGRGRQLVSLYFNGPREYSEDPPFCYSSEHARSDYCDDRCQSIVEELEELLAWRNLDVDLDFSIAGIDPFRHLRPSRIVQPSMVPENKETYQHPNLLDLETPPLSLSPENTIEAGMTIPDNLSEESDIIDRILSGEDISEIISERQQDTNPPILTENLQHISLDQVQPIFEESDTFKEGDFNRTFALLHKTKRIVNSTTVDFLKKKGWSSKASIVLASAWPGRKFRHFDLWGGLGDNVALPDRDLTAEPVPPLKHIYTPSDNPSIPDGFNCLIDSVRSGSRQENLSFYKALRSKALNLAHDNPNFRHVYQQLDAGRPDQGGYKDLSLLGFISDVCGVTIHVVSPDFKTSFVSPNSIIERFVKLSNRHASSVSAEDFRNRTEPRVDCRKVARCYQSSGGLFKQARWQFRKRLRDSQRYFYNRIKNTLDIALIDEGPQILASIDFFNNKKFISKSCDDQTLMNDLFEMTGERVFAFRVGSKTSYSKIDDGLVRLSDYQKRLICEEGSHPEKVAVDAFCNRVCSIPVPGDPRNPEKYYSRPRSLRESRRREYFARAYGAREIKPENSRQKHNFSYNTWDDIKVPMEIIDGDGQLVVTVMYSTLLALRDHTYTDIESIRQKIVRSATSVNRDVVQESDVLISQVIIGQKILKIRKVEDEFFSEQNRIDAMTHLDKMHNVPGDEYVFEGENAISVSTYGKKFQVLYPAQRSSVKIAKYRDQPKKISYCRRLFGKIPNLPIVYNKFSHNNEVHSLLCRGNKATPPSYPLAPDLVATIEQICNKLPKATDFSMADVDEYLESVNWTATKKRNWRSLCSDIYENRAELHSFFHSRRHTEQQIFIKDEGYLKHKPPRCIFNARSLPKVLMALMYWKVNKALFSIPGFDVHRDERVIFELVSKAMSPYRRFMTADHSAFEASNSGFLRQIDRKIMECLGTHPTIIEWHMRPYRILAGRTCTMTATSFRMSGDYITSLFNTIVNYSCIVTALRRQTSHFDLYVAGDDSIVGFNNLNEGKLHDDMRLMGFNVEAQFSDRWEQFGFCGMTGFSGQLAKDLLPQLESCMVTHNSTMRPKDHRDALITAMAMTNPGSYFLRSLADKIKGHMHGIAVMKDNSYYRASYQCIQSYGGVFTVHANLQGPTTEVDDYFGLDRSYADKILALPPYLAVPAAIVYMRRMRRVNGPTRHQADLELNGVLFKTWRGPPAPEYEFQNSEKQCAEEPRTKAHAKNESRETPIHEKVSRPRSSGRG